ncbi:4'-phosphopantetheinyl transferase EntD [Micromonospora pisi]|uniref:4'-phosphopantetheinyl transferase EntD n=1 Tax=Micromonospora pisi TaxID=589240 RepID=A0A495JV09_9ACTN|nr:4'-phosphopantetheinyl transferase superfamily protein [Micromonospora pisi]RKR92388.1 4'-phosphopantetheinyl transferase EntD [Micromonospora pisi]
MIERLLPSSVSAVEAFDDQLPALLFPEEEALVTNAVEKRRREFATARRCAREAMAGLGLAPVALLPGPNREPRWPDGVVGSITHCDGYRAAAVARNTELLTLGVDAEPNQPLPSGVRESIALSRELVQLAELTTAEPSVHWDRLLFCAKEAVYKAWFPLARRWLDFHEARVEIEPYAGTFTATLLVPGPVVDGTPISGFTGRWLADRGLLLAVIALPVTRT